MVGVDFHNFHSVVRSVKMTEIPSHNFLKKIPWNDFTKVSTKQEIQPLVKKISSNQSSLKASPQHSVEK